MVSGIQESLELGVLLSLPEQRIKLSLTVTLSDVQRCLWFIKRKQINGLSCQPEKAVVIVVK